MQDKPGDDAKNANPKNGKGAPAGGNAPRTGRTPQDGAKGQVIDLAEYRKRKGR